MFPFGHGNRDFRAMVEVGLASILALRPPRASSLSYAELWRRDDLGALASGKLADIVDMPVDPTDDVSVNASADFVKKALAFTAVPRAPRRDPASRPSLPLLAFIRMYLHLMDFVGVFAFAVSGALRAGREGMDLFGVLVVAAVTAIGGGTVRDVLLGEPVYWLSDVTYLYVIAAAAVCTLVYTRFRRPPHGALLVADAFGLAVFAVLGARAGLGAGYSPLVAVIMGAITGVVGGAVRDMLFRKTPLILRREIYATAAIAGATTYVVLNAWNLGNALVVTASIAVGLALRLIAVRFALNLPTERPRE
jgi:uncharacterized membrane protein YeiH